MNEPRLEKHVEAARRELRVRAWDAPRVETAWRELSRRHATDERMRRRATRVGGAVLALAAVFALALGALRWFRSEPAPSAKAVGVDTSAFERLALGEGTEVRFAPGARLDVRERTETRVVVTVRSGAARFRVRHDPRRLFRVEAGDVSVEDLGTAFAVEHEGGSVRVSVSEGSVEVSFPPEGGRAHQKVTLEAGETGVYPSQRSKAAAAPPSEASPAPPASGQATDAGAEIRAAGAWRDLARAGNHRRAYELLAPGGFRDVRDDPSDLLLASDVARLSQHPAEAAMLLRKLLAHHERDPRAPSAAFTLGWVLMNELGRPREAAGAFARAEALAPRGNLAEDAVARGVEAWYRAGELSRAQVEVERYRKRYPQGRHRATLERLVGTP
jgi:transmembrane sensor